MKKYLLLCAACLLAAACKNTPVANKLDGDGMERDTTLTDTTTVAQPTDTVAEEGEAVGEEQGTDPYEQYDIRAFDEMPKTAERKDAYFQWAVYVNEEVAPTEDNPVGTYTVWLADERSGTVARILQTNPNARAPWDRMEKNAIPIPTNLVATAEKAWLAPGDVSKVIVEGCPDSRNYWTYIIDCNTNTAKMFPTTEGVVLLDWDHGEIILASYGYHEGGGRYSQKKAYNLNGVFLRNVGKPEDE